MARAAKFLTAGVFGALLIAAPSLQSDVVQAQAPAGAPPTRQGQPTFSVSVDLITTDLIARDSKDQFVADLKPGELEVYEDGIKQEIASLVLTHGGKVYNVQSPPPAPVQEGIILPRSRPTNDAAGRVFLIFIDDLHLDFRMTPKVRELMKKMMRNLIHEGDMFGMVSTGTSSISEQLTYDRQILESSIDRVTGSGLRYKDILEGAQGAQGPSEVRHRAHVAFSTAYDLVRNLEKLQNRRKAVIYLSSGYDFNPFEKGRFDEQMRRMNPLGGDETGQQQQTDPFFRSQQNYQFAEADLVRELSELTRAANRANATFYTIDPRGLVAGADIDENIDIQDWNNYVRETQDSLRVIAEETGGIAVVNQNDFDKALKRIDAETSDYYVLGYYSKNPDPLKRTRRLEVKATRPGVNVWSRTSYTFRPLPAADAK